MKNKLAGLFACAAVFFLLATPALASERQTLHGHVPPEVAQFNLQPVDRLPATNRLHFAINLPLRNNEALDKLIRQVYDPASTNFHGWLTPEQFTEKFGPSPKDYQAVLAFAKANGLTVTRPHPGRAIAGIDGAVADIEKTLHIKMLVYQHPTEARRFYAPDVEPSLDLDVPILAISGLNNYQGSHSDLHPTTRRNPLRGDSAGAGSGTQGYLGADLRNAYVPGVPLKGTGQVVGLVEKNGSGFVGAGGYNTNDVELYESLTGAPNVPLISIFQPNPPVPPGFDNGELALDIDMVIAMAPGLDAIVLYYPIGTNNEVLATDEEMYQEMASPTNGEPRPKQISTSWSNDMGPASTNYLRELAVQGQSYFYYSGDKGAYPVKTNDEPGYYWVTVVGGTALTMNGTGASWSNETVWANNRTAGTGVPYGSAGGIYTALPIPFYQQGINMTSNQGSTSNRNSPDVAMVAQGLEIVSRDTNGQQQVIGANGTSAATPLWAAFAALVNQEAASRGKPPIGFLNPALYSIAQSPLYPNCFHDITNGNNTWSNSPTTYFAAPGYDLCTGWGSPTGTNLINALVGLSGPVYVNFNYTGATSTNGSYDYPWKTLAQGTNAVATGGTIFIITGGSSPETMKISKPMHITAIDGTATVGH